MRIAIRQKEVRVEKGGVKTILRFQKFEDGWNVYVLCAGEYVANWEYTVGRRFVSFREAWCFLIDKGFTMDRKIKHIRTVLA